MHEIESRIPKTPDDGYMVLLNAELENWSAEDRALFKEETGYVISLRRQYGAKVGDPDFCEQKIMERFAEEEAARS